MSVMRMAVLESWLAGCRQALAMAWAAAVRPTAWAMLLPLESRISPS
jgi:hypothetical protein